MRLLPYVLSALGVGLFGFFFWDAVAEEPVAVAAALGGLLLVALSFAVLRS